MQFLRCAAAICLAVGAAASCPSTAQCNCGWAQQWGCGHDDGSLCWQTCCACKGPSSNGTSGAATTPSPTLPPLQPGWSKGETTRYWDCCKPSCAWSNKFRVKKPLRVCDSKGVEFAHSAGADARNSCDKDKVQGAAAYMCPDQQPMFDPETNTSLLFAAAKLLHLSEADWCCSCYELLLDQVTKAGRMIVQVTNTGSDLHDHHFDLQVPGGGWGIFDRCAAGTSDAPPMFPSMEPKDFGAQYGGLLAAGATDSSACKKLPEVLREGCRWFFERLGAANNPKMQFKRVRCPAKIVEASGCVREDEEELFPEVPQKAAVGDISSSSSSSESSVSSNTGKGPVSTTPASSTADATSYEPLIVYP